MRVLWRWSAGLAAVAIVALASCSGGDDGPTDPDPTGSIRATVTGDGAALAAVTVRVFADGGATALESGATGANGQVTFTELAVGDYDVEVVVPAGFELAAGQTARRDVAVEEDGLATVTFALAEIVVPPTEGQIRARVLEGTAGVPGVEVSLYAAGGSVVLESLTTEADGRVLFDGLTAGAFDVEIEVPVDYQIAASDTTRKAVTVTAGAISDVEFLVEGTGPPTVEITLSGTSFSPDDVTIAPGTRVRWVRVNGSHTVTPTGHSEWTSATLDAPGEVFEHTFGSAGTFNYHCIPHQSLGMTGVIRVQ